MTETGKQRYERLKAKRAELRDGTPEYRDLDQQMESVVIERAIDALESIAASLAKIAGRM